MFHFRSFRTSDDRLLQIEGIENSQGLHTLGFRVILYTLGMIWLLAGTLVVISQEITWSEIIPLGVGLISLGLTVWHGSVGRIGVSSRLAVATIWIIFSLDLFINDRINPFIFFGFFVITFLGGIFIHTIRPSVLIAVGVLVGGCYYLYAKFINPAHGMANNLQLADLGLYLLFLSFALMIGRWLGSKLDQSYDHSGKINQLFQAIFHQSTDAIFIIDLNLRILQLNHQAAELVKQPSEEVIGKKILDFVPLNAENQVNELVSDIMSKGKIANIQMCFRNSAGTDQHLQISGNLIFQESGKPDHIQVILRDITERKKVEDRIQRLALQDHLTQVDNRLSLNYRLNSLISKMARDGGRFALVYFDLDNFKGVNDRYGHYIGDQLLVAFTKRLHGAIRKTDFLARLGGDEFVLILEDYSSEEDLEFTLDRINNTLAKPFKIGEHLIYLEASFGISFYPDDGEDAEQLLKCADSAMYSDKRA